MTEVSMHGVNPGAAEFPHRQIAAALRARIRRGDWAAGERLPSIPALAAMFGVAKQTIQRTIDQLRVEGLLITKPGSGTYVRGTRRRLNRLSRGRYGAYRGYHADLAARYRQQLVSVGREPAPPEVADAFGVPDNTELVVRRYFVRTLDTSVSQVTVEIGRPGSVRPMWAVRRSSAPSPSAAPHIRRSRRSPAAATRPPPTSSAPACPPAKRPNYWRCGRIRPCCTCCTSRTTRSISPSRWPSRPGRVR